MRSSRPLRLSALVAIVALAGACSDSSTGPTTLQPADLGQVLAELQPSSLAALNSQISAAPIAGLSAPVPSSCTYDATSKSFLCPNVSVTGVTVTRSFTLLDASGNAQSQFDQATTAAVRLKTTFAGTVASGGTTLAIDQQQDATLSGLLSGVHTLDATSLGHVNGTVGNGTTTMPINSTIATTITSLVLPRTTTGADRFPASGTIAVNTTTTLGALPAFTQSATITFNGTSKAAVAVTTNGHTVTCTVDLAAQSAPFCTA
jgi:hypothetical protein